LYDDIGREEPAFERVTELAKAVALAKWLKKEGIPVNREWMLDCVNRRNEYVVKAPRLTYQWDNKNNKTYREGNKIITETSSIQLSGGVDLTVIPEYRPDDGQTARIEKIVYQHLNKGIENPVFEISVDGQAFMASIVPFTRKGGQLWEDRQDGFAREPGINYDFSDEGKLLKKIEQDGTRTEYEYDESKRLSQVKIVYKNNSETQYQKNDSGSSWFHTKSNGKTIEYFYDSKGYLTNFKADDQELATYSYDFDNRKIEAHYPGYSESIKWDKSGKKYILEFRRNIYGSTREYVSSKYEYRYNSRGNLIHISEDGSGLIDIIYLENDNNIAKLIAPGLTTEYFYDNYGRLAEIKGSDNSKILYLYGENEQLTIQVEKDSLMIEYAFDENGIRYSKNIFGETVDYDYENGKLISLKSNRYGETKIDYDENGNLKQVHLPDGRSIQYQYLLRDISKNGKKQSIVRLLRIRMHPIVE
jgi:YD repeat-containing protein